MGCRWLTPALGETYAEAAAVCFAETRLHGPQDVAFIGTTARLRLTWAEGTEAMRRSHNDLQDATEFGAYGIAIVAAKRVTGHDFLERSRKGTGFDIWLGSGKDLFQRRGRLEVSGILRGSEKAVRARMKVKARQTATSDETRITAYVAVVEFSRLLLGWAER